MEGREVSDGSTHPRRPGRTYNKPVHPAAQINQIGDLPAVTASLRPARIAAPRAVPSVFVTATVKADRQRGGSVSHVAIVARVTVKEGRAGGYLAAFEPPPVAQSADIRRRHWLQQEW
jgi:hypothetical protein